MGVHETRCIPFVAALLLVAFAGCAGPPRAVLPPLDDASEQVPAGHRVLKTGDTVRIETRSRRVVLGEVKEVTQHHVVVGRVGNFGYVEESISANDISIIELDGGKTRVLRL